MGEGNGNRESVRAKNGRQKGGECASKEKRGPRKWRRTRTRGEVRARQDTVRHGRTSANQGGEGRKGTSKQGTGYAGEKDYIMEGMSRPRIELRTFCVLDRCDNQLRHRPMLEFHCVLCHGIPIFALSPSPFRCSAALLQTVMQSQLIMTLSLYRAASYRCPSLAFESGIHGRG